MPMHQTELDLIRLEPSWLCRQSYKLIDKNTEGGPFSGSGKETVHEAHDKEFWDTTLRYYRPDQQIPEMHLISRAAYKAQSLEIQFELSRVEATEMARSHGQFTWKADTFGQGSDAGDKPTQ